MLKQDRRKHLRVSVDYQVSLSHPSFGQVDGYIGNMSSSGMSLTLSREVELSALQQVDAQIYGDGWDDSMPPLPMLVIRMQAREVALQFVENVDESYQLAPGNMFNYLQRGIYCEDGNPG